MARVERPEDRALIDAAQPAHRELLRQWIAPAARTFARAGGELGGLDAPRAYGDLLELGEVAARRFEDHGSVTGGRDLPELEQVTVSARSVQTAELTAGASEGARRRSDPMPEQLTMRRLRGVD